MRILSLYRRTLTELFRQLQHITTNRFAHGPACLLLQYELIKYITSVEGKIRSKKKAAKAIRKELGGQQCVPLKKEDAQRLKLKVKKIENQIEEYVKLISILREVGDGLAFTYLDRFDIKPMAFKSPPGFISGKDGGRLERQYLRHCFKEKKIAILNDLTNCMRYGDVTIICEESGPTISEVKSSSRVNARGQRQMDGLQKLGKYFREDVVEELYGFKGPITRIALDREEVHHREELNSLIALSIEKNTSLYKEVEEGLFYVVETEQNTVLHEVLRKPSGTPNVAIINDLKQNNTAYYPFTLSLKCPDHLFRFYEGEFVVLVVIDSDVITSTLLAHSLSLKFMDDETWPIAISKGSERQAPAVIKISSHFWGRLPAEFLSLKWFLDEIAKFSNI